MSTKTDPLLTRRQFAAILGITENEVKQKDNTVFHPSKAPDGSFRYGVDELLSVLRTPTGTESEASPDGAVCAAAFALFTEGKALIEAVIALKQPPALVRTLRAEYDSMAGTLTIPAEVVALLEAGSKQKVRSASQLLVLIDSLRAERDAAYEQGLNDAGDQDSVRDPRMSKTGPLGNPARSDSCGPKDVTAAGAASNERKEKR